MLWLCTFQMGLITYVSLLLLAPRILSLPFDPQDNAFLSWAHSYAAFLNQSNCWVCGALPSSLVEGFPWWTPPLKKKDWTIWRIHELITHLRYLPLFLILKIACLKTWEFRSFKYLLHILLLDTLQINAVLSFTTTCYQYIGFACQWASRPKFDLVTGRGQKEACMWILLDSDYVFPSWSGCISMLHHCNNS